MNMQEYVDMKLANTINEESWDALLRKLAFIEFDSQLEEFVENGWESENDGRSLMDITPADVDRIADEFATRFDAYVQPAIDDCIRNAIQAVTGLVC